MTCGHDNPYVEEYGDRYVCAQNCLKQLKLQTGELVTLKVSRDGRHINSTVNQKGVLLKNQKVDLCNLQIFGLPCYATFAGESNKIVILLN